jgi:hypothetical protein
MRLSLSFIKCIVDYEHYVPLSMPLETTIDSAATLKEKFW